jgi:hypothetical protein
MAPHYETTRSSKLFSVRKIAGDEFSLYDRNTTAAVDGVCNTEARRVLPKDTSM